MNARDEVDVEEEPEPEREPELDPDDDPETVVELQRVVHEEPSAEEAAMHIIPSGSPPEPGLTETEEIMEALAIED